VAVLGKIEDPESYQFTDLFLMEPSPGSRAHTLLSLSSGEPLLLSLQLGKGQAFLYLSTVDLDWNTFALRPFFLPFVRGITAFMAGSAQSPLQKPYTVGDTVLIESSGMVTVENPSGRRSFFLPETGSVCFQETAEPGIYAVRRDRAKEAWFAVNLDPSESDFTAAPPGRLEGIFAGVPFLRADVRANLGGDILKPRPLWTHCLFGALVLILLESLLCAAPARKPEKKEAAGAVA
jgi:hypothetical protein